MARAVVEIAQRVIRVRCGAGFNVNAGSKSQDVRLAVAVQVCKAKAVADPKVDELTHVRAFVRLAPIDPLRKSVLAVAVVWIDGCRVGIDIGGDDAGPAIAFEISDRQGLGFRASAIDSG